MTSVIFLSTGQNHWPEPIRDQEPEVPARHVLGSADIDEERL